MIHLTRYRAKVTLVTMDTFATEMLHNIWPDWQKHIIATEYNSEFVQDKSPWPSPGLDDVQYEHALRVLHHHIFTEISNGIKPEVTIEENI